MKPLIGTGYSKIVESYLSELENNRISKQAKEYSKYIGEGHFSILGYIAGYKEALEDVKHWLTHNTDWDMEYNDEGYNRDFGKIEQLIKDIENDTI